MPGDTERITNKNFRTFSKTIKLTINEQVK